MWQRFDNSQICDKKLVPTASTSWLLRDKHTQNAQNTQNLLLIFSVFSVYSLPGGSEHFVVSW